MNAKTKESKFLDAINKYAKKQQAIMDKEVADYKAEKIEQATQSGLNDAYQLIKEEVSRRKAAIVTTSSRSQQELRRDLFRYRQELCDAVFSAARERLSDYINTEQYTDHLTKIVAQIAESYPQDNLKVYLSAADQSKSDNLGKILPHAEFITDPKITIGGLKAVIPSLNILIDETLDAKLQEQYAWFEEHSGLKVV